MASARLLVKKVEEVRGVQVKMSLEEVVLVKWLVGGVSGAPFTHGLHKALVDFGIRSRPGFFDDSEGNCRVARLHDQGLTDMKRYIEEEAERLRGAALPRWGEWRC